MVRQVATVLGYGGLLDRMLFVVSCHSTAHAPDDAGKIQPATFWGHLKAEFHEVAELLDV